MKFNIRKCSVSYGGGPSGHEYKTIHENVSEDFVKGFFQNLELDKDFKTKEDNMGCYDAYQVIVVSV